MKNAEKICREYWATCVKRRDKWCICGVTDIQAHHLFPLSQGYWPALFDIDYGVSLCIDHHGEITEDLYGELFEKILNNIRQNKDEIMWGNVQDYGRADKILAYHNSVKTPCPIPADFAVLKKQLSKLLTNIKDHGWTEFDIEPGYGDAK